MAWDHYHVPLVRTQLTQNIAALMAVIMEEMKIAFTAEMPMTDGIVYVHSLTRLDSVQCVGKVFEYGLPDNYSCLGGRSCLYAFGEELM
jgi:hypothetical protein